MSMLLKFFVGVCFPERINMDSQQKYQIRNSHWRLQWLELQALVAGLDYEVEQKMYPQYFIKMAEGAGLICVAHERVYGTVGLSDDGARTHVMAFRKA